MAYAFPTPPRACPGPTALTLRRIKDKPQLQPDAVMALDPGHPAMAGNRTIFPSTVVEVTRFAPERLLVSGMNNRKLGKTVAKGRLAGFALYGLTLEERATCPVSCGVRDVCYGNGMHLARRHRVGDAEVFEGRLHAEIGELLAEHRAGILVRLHVLGDFPSAPYVAMWGRLLDRFPRLACYGYTHRLPAADGGCAIGDAVAALKARHPDRFRIRWSVTAPVPDGAVVIDQVPGTSRVAEGLVCPAQTDATACCASCGLCWEPAARGQTIAFIRHGRASVARAAQTAMAAIESARDPALGEGVRRIAPLRMPANQKPGPVSGAPPRFETVDPRTLLVEERYQRDLAPGSIRLIRKIVTAWDWSKFKPPVCASTPAGLYVIDGQHTSIGAATHPDIAEIPVMVIPAESVADRASAFVAHNRDRVAMSEAAILVAEVAAGIPRSVAVHDAIAAAGGQFPRMPPAKGRAKPGDVVSVTAARRVLAAGGPAHLERIVRIAIDAGCRPIDSTVLLGLHQLLVDHVVPGPDDPAVADALRRLSLAGDLAAAGMRQATLSGLSSRYKGLAALVARRLPATGHVQVQAFPREPQREGAPAAALPVPAAARPSPAPAQPRALPPARTGPVGKGRGARYEWTAERVATFNRLAAQNRTARQIMEALGDGVTRNAVIGRLFRLKRDRGVKRRPGRPRKSAA